MYNRVDTPGDVCNIENDFAFLDKWSKQWKLQFNVNKCNIMHLGRRNPHSKCRFGSSVLSRILEKKDLGVLIYDSFRMSQ